MHTTRLNVHRLCIHRNGYWEYRKHNAQWAYTAHPRDMARKAEHQMQRNTVVQYHERRITCGCTGADTESTESNMNTVGVYFVRTSN